MAEFDQQVDVVFKALVVEAARVVGAGWALRENFFEKNFTAKVT